jgi:hypothetical protein
MANVQIVAYSENIFNIPAGVNEALLKDKQVAVGINPVLRYKEGTDALGCQMRVAYSLDGRQIMDYAAVVTVLVGGWSEILKKTTDGKEIVAASKEAWMKTIDFVRGIICANANKTGNVAVARMMLPNVDMDKFLENVSVEKLS